MAVAGGFVAWGSAYDRRVTRVQGLGTKPDLVVALEDHAEPVRQAPATSPPLRVTAPDSAAVDEDGPPSQREAVEAWVAQGDSNKLSNLLAIDVVKDLEAAPAVIMGIARLSKDAAPSIKAQAAFKLERMLLSERQRAESRDLRGAGGNIATGIDALGEMGATGNVDARAALLRALDGGTYELHHETRMVQELGKQKYAPAKAALMRFVTRTQARKLEDAFDLELQKEALSAVDEALVLLGG